MSSHRSYYNHNGISSSFSLLERLLISILIIISINVVLNHAYGLSQHFEKRPDNQYNRLRGQRLEMPCVVRNRQGECLWIRNGQVITPIPNKYDFQRTPLNGDCSLIIDNLDLRVDNGAWQCQVTSPSVQQDSLISNTANVVVLVAPSKPLIKQLVANYLPVHADRSDEVECQVENGNPPPNVKWFIDNVDVTQNARSNVIYNAAQENSSTVHSYLTQTFKRNHRNATIVCQALHPTINQNDSAIIDVMYAPQVTVPQTKYILNEDTDLSIDCQVDANPPARAIWKHIRGVHFPNVRIESNVLHINRITRDMNAAEFECSAQNDLGTSQPVSVTLDVLYQPRLLKASEPQQSVQYGEATRLYCDYDGNPKPNIFWYQINPISDVVRHRPNQDKNASILIIQNATYHDEGHYYCEALNHNSIINKDFIVRSAKFVVDIIGKPEIIQNPAVVQGIRGSQSDVYQVFCSDPPPTSVFWQFGSIRLETNKLDKQQTYSYQDSISNSISNPDLSNSSLHARYNVRNLIPLDKTTFSAKPTCFQATLSIVNTDPSDQREYTLFVENERGITEGIIKLKVVAPLSAGVMIAIGFIVFIMLFTLTILTIILIKKRRLKSKQDDSKTEAQTPMKPTEDSDKDKEHHELVYANLDFTKSSDQSKPPKVANKPQAQQRQSRPTNGSKDNKDSTEYAQIKFTNKADL